MTTSAYAFLFDGSADGLPNSPLEDFVAAVFGAVSRADPVGSVRTQVRAGLPSLLRFADRTTAVHGTKSGSGRTVSSDLDLYKYVIWEWLDSLGGGWSSVDREAGERIFRRHSYECVALSALSEEVRDQVDPHLREVPGYVGSFALDPGNPVHRGGFFDGLIYAAAIVDGTVYHERTIDGDENPEWDGAASFKPGGLVWKDYGWLQREGPDGLPRAALSERGAQAAAAMARKAAPNIERRVLDEMDRVFFLNAERKTFALNAVGQKEDVLEALMPEGKFTHYLFNREHKDGGPKAAFIIDELGIDPEDWRYLAGQFYVGLTRAQPEAVKLNEWKDGIGVRFDVVMRVRNRAGGTAVLGTGWNMNPGKLPSLSTAFPGKRDAQAVEPGDVPILPPGPHGDDDWAQLWRWANDAGVRASEEVVPTPMYIVGYAPIVEGEVGSALVRVPDARRGLARWLLKHSSGERDSYGGAVAFSPIPTQSFDRAVAWAQAVALILRLNGIDAGVESFKN